MKCAICFTDAGDQTCDVCGSPACDAHRNDEGVCPDRNRHEAAKAVKDEEVKEEETPEESPQLRRRSRRRSPRAKPEA